jgi:hypothetical protein
VINGYFLVNTTYLSSNFSEFMIFTMHILPPVLILSCLIQYSPKTVTIQSNTKDNVNVFDCRIFSGNGERFCFNSLTRIIQSRILNIIIPFCETRVRTQGFVLAQQELYHLSHISSPIFLLVKDLKWTHC